MNRPLFAFLHQRKKVLLFLFLALNTGNCFASLEDFSEQSFTLDVPVVLSASRLRQPLSEAPNAVTVIDRNIIAASGFRNLPDLFRLVPGMYVDQISDIIFLDPTTLVNGGRPYSFHNLMSATYKGLEATVKYRWSKQSGLTFNFTHQQASCAITGTMIQPAFVPILQRDIASVCPVSVPSDSGSILITQRVKIFSSARVTTTRKRCRL